MLRTILSLAACSLCAQSPLDLWERRDQLQTEDLRSVRFWFGKKDTRISRFIVADKRPVDGTYSVLLVTGSVERNQASVESLAGVFVVYGKTNQVYMVLDLTPAPQWGLPALEIATNDTVHVHWFGDYGFYGGSYKYVYHLLHRRPARRYTYRRFFVERRETQDGEILFEGHYKGPGELGTEQVRDRVSLARNVRDGRWRIRDAAKGPVGESKVSPGAPEAVLKHLPPGAGEVEADRIVTLAQGGWLYVPASESGQGSGVHVIGGDGRRRFYPVPVPSGGVYQRLRGRGASAPGTLTLSVENRIGPLAYDGKRLWFANSFYDGEGTTGVGGIGSFDVATRKYEMRYLPEVAPWSGSALLLEGESIWIGLMRQPEGNPYGGGVVQFNIRTGSILVYPITQYVSGINRIGADLYFATDHGVYTLNTATDRLTHVRIEPDASGPRQVVAREIPAKR